MPVKIGKPPAGRWEKVDLGEHGDFEVFITPPKFRDVVQEAETLAGYAEYRVRKVITDWRGLETDDGPLPFSWENLVAVCEAYPVAFRRMQKLANDAFYRLSEDAEKNSEPPPTEPSQVLETAANGGV